MARLDKHRNPWRVSETRRSASPSNNKSDFERVNKYDLEVNFRRGSSANKPFLKIFCTVKIKYCDIYVDHMSKKVAVILDSKPKAS